MDPLNTRKLRPLLPRSTTLVFTRNAATSSYSSPPPQNLIGVAATTPSMKKQAKTIPSRWCPTPQQVHALREMYRSGLRTPTAKQIEQIASWLGQFGKIEGKNVFYWFQNHKARERQKLRRHLKPHLIPQQQQQQQQQQKMAPTFPQESAAAMDRQVESESSSSGKREPSRQHRTTTCTPPVVYSVTASDINAVYQNEDSQTLELFPLLSNGRRRSTLGLCSVAKSDTTNSTIVAPSRGSPEINDRQSSSPTHLFDFFPLKN